MCPLNGAAAISRNPNNEPVGGRLPFMTPMRLLEVSRLDYTPTVDLLLTNIHQSITWLIHWLWLLANGINFSFTYRLPFHDKSTTVVNNFFNCWWHFKTNIQRTPFDIFKNVKQNYLLHLLSPKGVSRDSFLQWLHLHSAGCVRHAKMSEYSRPMQLCQSNK